MSETLEQAAEAAYQAIEKLNALGETWRAQADRQSIELTRQRESREAFKEAGITGPILLDGHPIEYWHQIATSTLKTNNELIDRLREKERINADLEQQLKSAEIAAQTVEKKREGYIFDLEKRLIHQTECATRAIDERDTALRELDAMRERLIHAERQMDIAHTALLQR